MISLNLYSIRTPFDFASHGPQSRNSRPMHLKAYPHPCPHAQTLVVSLLAFLFSNLTVAAQNIYLGQGILAGEITDRQAILQTRLTADTKLTDWELAGASGWGRFEYSEYPNFKNSTFTPWEKTVEKRDFILKAFLDNLKPNTIYHYRILYGGKRSDVQPSYSGSFRTHPGIANSTPLSLAFTTCVNHYKYYFGLGGKNAGAGEILPYTGPDKDLGYPGLKALEIASPDYVFFNGDTVYYDGPSLKYDLPKQAFTMGDEYWSARGDPAKNQQDIRRKYHIEFNQPRFHSLLAKVGTYWAKDDHDFRTNDSDPHIDDPVSTELGIYSLKEQLPVAPLDDPDAKTYRTYRVSKDLQVWMTEGRDYRSPNAMPDGPDKTLWGVEQREWLKRTLVESDATYKVLVSPTPMVGPEDAYKNDNHCLPNGFLHEGDAFFNWLEKDSGIPTNQFFIICGDRHWQYHSIHKTGYHEFSSGALDDSSGRVGRVPGDPESTDPNATVTQLYVHDTPQKVSGGFISLDITPRQNTQASAKIRFSDENGTELYVYSFGP